MATIKSNQKPKSLKPTHELVTSHFLPVSPASQRIRGQGGGVMATTNRRWIFTRRPVFFVCLKPVGNFPPWEVVNNYLFNVAMMIFRVVIYLFLCGFFEGGWGWGGWGANAMAVCRAGGVGGFLVMSFCNS